MDNLQKFTAISIPAQLMHPLGDQHTIYKLLFRIKVKPVDQDGAVIANGGDNEGKFMPSEL